MKINISLISKYLVGNVNRLPCLYFLKEIATPSGQIELKQRFALLAYHKNVDCINEINL